MLDRTPFQQFLAPRISRTRDRVRDAIWRPVDGALTYAQTPPTHEHRGVADVDPDEFRPIDVKSLPMTWGRKWQQCWWKVTLPPAADDQRRWLRWNDQAEATLYRPNGDGWTPHFGIDPGHLVVPLPDGVDTVWIESTCCRTGVWVSGSEQQVTPEGSLFRGGEVLVRDDDAWHAWHDLDVLMGLCGLLHKRSLPKAYGPRGGDVGGAEGNSLFSGGGYRTPLEACPPLLRKLLDRLTDAADAFDQKDLAAMRRITSDLIDSTRGDPNAIDATLTGHAHIDLAWKWPECIGDFKAVHSLATANHLLNDYPELHFGYSQPGSYEAVGRRAPELLDRIKQQAAGPDARWEATGAMYVESDTQLPCGEALIRAIELGQAGFRELTGDDSKTLWLPDVFGYSAVLPQLLSGFDVPYFFTTKMHWSAATRFPHSAFRWQGNDGETEVLGFIAWEHYNLTLSAVELDWAASNQRQSHLLPETLMPVGYGDGGGGVTATMCERARRQAELADLPRAKWGRIDGFFDRLADVQDKLPTWRGEMYLEYHRGVQTTHVRLKQAYRAAERALQTLEAARCLVGETNDQQTITDWKRVCWAQFHDVLPGSSLQEVYDEINPELEAIADRCNAAALELLQARGSTSCVFNPVPCDRIELIDGQPRRLPPLAGVATSALEAADAHPVSRDGNTIDNGRVRVSFNDKGDLTHLAFDDDPIRLVGNACSLYTFADRAALYDAWDIDRNVLSLGQPCDAPAELNFFGDATSMTVSVARQVGQSSRVEVRYQLDAGACALRVEVDVDWQDPETLLKLTMPTDYRDADASYGGPFGTTRRSQRGQTVGEDAQFEVPASRWMSIAEPGSGRGVAIITEATYGMGCFDGLAHVSLVRSPKMTEADLDVSLRDFDAYHPQATHQPFTDIGRHTIRLALAASREDAPRREQPAQLADVLFTPIHCYKGSPRSAGLADLGGGDSLVAAWAKPEQDGWTLRLSETAGRHGEVHLTTADGVAMEQVNLKGNPTQPINGDTLPFKPHQLLSLRMKRC